jgi:transposase-like protein
MPARSAGALSPTSPRAAFAQEDAAIARDEWRRVADQLGPKRPKLASFLDSAQTDGIDLMTFPPAHRLKLRPTSSLELSTAKTSAGLRWPESSRATPTSSAWMATSYSISTPSATSSDPAR